MHGMEEYVSIPLYHGITGDFTACALRAANETAPRLIHSSTYCGIDMIYYMDRLIDYAYIQHVFSVYVCDVRIYAAQSMQRRRTAAFCLTPNA